MKNKVKLILVFSSLAVLFSDCSRHEKDNIKLAGPEIVTFRALPFNLEDIKLLDGPFLHATELDVNTLLGYEPDRLLSKFYSEAGLKPKAKHYGGWEDETIAGHSLGHYLSACSMMYRTTGDKRFPERVNYIVSELKFLQDADGKGYIGAFPKGKMILEEEVAKGDIRSKGFDLNGIWAPFYTQHKIMAGLRDAYRFCGNKTALEVETRFAEWLNGIIKPLNDEQIQKMLRCEHGGISETLADLYADTKDKKFLNLSQLFYQKAILDSLKMARDVLPGKHCNTNIPKLTALSRLYELTGDSTDRKAAEFFWHTVVSHHSYVTGGNGDNEYFGQPDKLRNRLNEGTTESCNVYNMLKLTEHIFEWNGSAQAADFYERALFNHILSSQNPEDGHVTYNLSLEMGGFKDFQDPEMFTCCIGTGMENHSKYGRNIFYHSEDELFVFQFIASELNWKDKGVIITQQTRYPEEQGSTFEFRCQKPVSFILQIRYPFWAKDGVEIKINHKSRKVSQKPGSFINIEKTWKTGDKVEVRIPFTLRLETMPDDSNRVAVMYGPLVLAGDLGRVKDSVLHDAMYVPVLMTSDRDPSSWMRPVRGKINTFVTVNTGRPRDVEMMPFYTMYKRRYSIYWDILDENGWQAKQARYKEDLEKMKKLKEAEIDFVQPGEMQTERDHKFRGEKTTAGRFKERANRESRGGWFSFDLKVKEGSPMAMVAEYWGGFPGARTFDILVNNNFIATESISNRKDGEFVSVQYDIPQAITSGSSNITICFRAHEGNTAGPVFGVRTIIK